MGVILRTIIAYYVVYSALWKLDSFFQRKTYQRFHKKYQKYQHQNNNSNAYSAGGMTLDKACEILGIKKEDLKNMSKDDLRRAYWKKAKEVHPDKPNGSAEKFKDLNNAYDFAKA